MRITMLFSVTLLAFVTFVGCGGSDKSDGVAGQTPDPTQREISDQELGAMTVPLKDSGSQYAGYELTDSSGLQSNDSAIATADDKQDKEKDIEQFGRVKGYEASYVDWNAMTARQGPFMVGTWVDVLRDPNAADGYMADYVEDMKSEVGLTVNGGTVQTVRDFDAGEIRDGSKGVLAEIRLSSEADPSQPLWYITTVFIRRGRLVGAASVARTDDKDVRDEAAALARKLDERIDGVLSGQITGGSGGSS